MASQDPLYRTAEIVISQQSEYAAKVPECQLMRFQKRLLGRMRIRPVIRAAARHRSHTEDEHLVPPPTHLSPGFIPVNLCLLTPSITLRHKCSRASDSHPARPLPHVSPNRSFGYVQPRHLLPDPYPNPLRCV